MTNENSSPSKATIDRISSATSAEEFIRILARRGCMDLTPSVALASSGKLPFVGGEFCDVYQGTMNYGTKIAIKALRVFNRPGKDDHNEKTLKHAARELYHWSRLKHANVLPLMGLAMFRGHMALISEWMENGDLMSYLRLNPDADRMALCIDICTGLSHIHANEMVHGDLKAANIMVSPDGTAMITGFGSFQLRQLARKSTDTTEIGLSSRWAAPELLLAEDGPCVSQKADVYAYGMTVLETLTEKVPYAELSEERVMLLVTADHQTPARPTVGIGDKSVGERLQALYPHLSPESRATEDLCPSVDSSMSDSGDSSSLAVHPATTRKQLIKGGHSSRIWAMLRPSIGHITSKSAGRAPKLSAKTDSMIDRAARYKNQGRLADAEVLYIKVLAARKQALGDAHPDTLACIASLAAIYKRQGRLADAGSLYTMALTKSKESLGKDCPEMVRGMASLAARYYKQSQLVEAGSLEVEVLDSWTQALGADHPDTLSCMANLAATRYKQGRLADAESLYIEVLATRERVLGKDHLDTLSSMANLAATYRKQDRLEDAELLYVKVLAARKRLLGEDHPDSLQACRDLGRIYRAQGWQTEYEALITRGDSK